MARASTFLLFLLFLALPFFGGCGNAEGYGKTGSGQMEDPGPGSHSDPQSPGLVDGTYYLATPGYQCLKNGILLPSYEDSITFDGLRFIRHGDLCQPVEEALVYKEVSLSPDRLSLTYKGKTYRQNLGTLSTENLD